MNQGCCKIENMYFPLWNSFLVLLKHFISWLAEQMHLHDSFATVSSGGIGSIFEKCTGMRMIILDF